MRQTVSQSLDFIYFDPPFATTGNWWDEEMDWPAIFAECFRILKPTGTLAIHCSIPFNYTLIRAAPRAPSYSWYWKKNIKTNFLNVKKQPLRQVEEILVWKMPRARYYPQTTPVAPHSKASGGPSSYFSGSQPTRRPKLITEAQQSHLLEFPILLKSYSTRPLELIELMIKSYTQEGDLIYDPTCFHGVSGRVARSLGRRWIGTDKYHFPTELLQSPSPSSP